MAGWRALGYVPDSDEDDVTQPSVQLLIPSIEVDLRENPEKAREDGTGDGKKDTLLGGLDTSKKKTQKKLNGRNGRQKAGGTTKATLSTTNRLGRFVAVEIGAKKPSILSKHILEVEDIDELQQDHYEASFEQLKAAALPNTEVPNGSQATNAFPTGVTTTTRYLSSSPLSEPPPSPCFIVQSPEPGKSPIKIDDQISSPDLAGSQGPQRHILVEDGESCLELETNLGECQNGRPSRALRRRNPIQLHPYAIEDEKYRQVLKARGIKPLRITQMQESIETAMVQASHDANLDADEDSQLTSNDIASGLREHSMDPPSSPPSYDNDIMTFNSPLPIQTTLYSSPPLDTNPLQIEDEFPDIHELLRSHHPDAIPRGFKRQKVRNTLSRMKSTIFAGRKQAREIPSPSSEKHKPMLEDPPSPPQSTPLKPNQHKNQVFRFPREISPTALPTPATSSEQQPSSVVNLAEPLMYTIESSNESLSDDNQNITDQSESPPENATNHQLERAQRKIRGVLPASWLKLDLKNQKSKTESRARQRSTSPCVHGEHRGIARPVVGGKVRNPASPMGVDFPIGLSEDDTSDSISEGFRSAKFSRLRLQGTYEANNNHEPPSLISGGLDEVLEDNRIDEMIPSVRRGKPISNRKKGIQTKLVKGKNKKFQNVQRKLTKRSSKFPVYQPRITDRFHQNGRKKLPELSILDILTTGRPTDAPSFLKVASRTVRLRLDRGRHSPTSKFIRLATIDDTNDANQTLRSWREGTLAPMGMVSDLSRKESLDRQPLYPRSGNEQLFLPPALVSGNSGRNQPLSSRVKPSLSHLVPSNNTGVQKSFRHRVQRAPVSKGLARAKVGKLARVRNRNNAAIQRGQLLTTMQDLGDSRPAALESLQREGDRNNPRSAFHRHLSNTANGMETSQGSNVLLRRFLDFDIPNLSDRIPSKVPTKKGQNPNDTAHPHVRNDKNSRSRKSQPKRINIDSAIYYPIPSAASATSHSDDTLPVIRQSNAVVGLGPFGTRYTHTFDIDSLPSQVFFHANTFVGSGKFHKSLNISKPENMDKPRGYSLLRIDQHIVKCGPWTDSVSTQLGVVFDKILASLEPSSVGNNKIAYQHLVSSQMDIISYFSDHLSFSDGVDRISCLCRCKALVVGFLEEFHSRNWTPHERHRDYCLQVRTLVLAFSNQLWQICNHGLVPVATRDEFRSLMVDISRRNLHLAFNEGFYNLPRCLENLKHLEACEYGIREGFGSIEAIVVIYHILHEGVESSAPFWDIVRNAVVAQISTGVHDLGTLELSWRKLFTCLPFLDFDAQGIVKPKHRFHISNDDWPSVKLLIDPVLSSYQKDSVGHAPTLNTYCRALLSRCLHLINNWGWQRCQLIIGTFFDFFARNNLAFLIKEESHGSPAFLERLDQSQQLKSEPKDRSFHIFLKIVGTGLRCMRKIYSEKKMRDIVWRLMPNHGRKHPKDEAVSQRDLDALRNHHDLLCTLYWASPSSARPPISLIRNLVHLESSHREACHINIRAWANLIRFQLSTDEAISHLVPFAEWHKSILEQLVSQYNSARTEAEDHVRSIRHTEYDITAEHLQTTIIRNQGQVAAVLGDSLISLKIAVDASRTLECAHALLTPALILVFDLFDARRPRFHLTIMQALDVVQAFIKHCGSNDPAKDSGSGNDDSQDYGDWTAFTDNLLLGDEDLPAAAHPSQTISASATQLLETFHEPLKRLLSNCFGADTTPDDTLLLQITQVWVGLSQVLVRQDIKSWDDYITQYGTNSWDRLRKTEQSQKFNNYYLALLVEASDSLYNEHRDFFLSHWIESLVERESLAKFQNRLTMALLNGMPKDPLLENLPFWTDSRLGRFDITISEFLERRLSIISTVLSNMRDSLEEAGRQRSEDLSIRRQLYKGLIKRIMTAMKNKYLELGHGSSAKDAYIGFVQRIIEFLQQYTSEICPIDRFFTDALAFPLPTADPTYVAGRLRSYGLRLDDSRTPKQLSVYLQSVLERTATDGQHKYLVGQLNAAMTSTFEYGDAEKPTLLSFIVKAIVPAYLEVSLDSSIGWFVALPLLQALQPLFRRLLSTLDGANPTSLASVISIINAFLSAAQSSIGTLLKQTNLSDRLTQSHTLRLLSIIYSDITALLPILDYTIRLAEPTIHAAAAAAVQCIEFFKSFATFSSPSSALFLDPLSSHIPPSPLPLLLPHHLDTTTTTPSSYPEVQTFTLRELRDSLSRNWICHDGRYFLTRGQTRREITVETVSLDEAKRGFSAEIQSLFNVLETLPSFCTTHGGGGWGGGFGGWRGGGGGGGGGWGGGGGGGSGGGWGGVGGGEERFSESTLAAATTANLWI